MLSALTQSLKTLVNIGLILGVFNYMGSIIGMWLFSGELKFDSVSHQSEHFHDILVEEYGEHEEIYVSPRSNFDDIQSAFITVFHIVTGDQWNQVWYNCVRQSPNNGHPYFIIVTLIGKIIFMNAFISIMLGNFEIASNQADKSKEKVLILISSVLLALDNPLDDPESNLKQILFYLDIWFTILFSIEFIIKVIALGFFFNSQNKKQAYFRNPWNILDFVVVATSIIDLSGLTTINSLKALKSLRSLRALRPLKMVARNEDLKFLVDAIFATIPILGTLLFVSGMIMWIFAILMMSMQKGQMYYCYLLEESNLKYIITKNDCLDYGGTWVNYIWNFDNIINSGINIFKIIVGENWVQIMWVTVDSVGKDLQPIKEYRFYKVFIFLLLVFICNILILNLFIGLVINNFRRLKSQNGGYLLLTDQQKQWVDMQRVMIRKKLKVIIPIPKQQFRYYCFQLSMHQYFERVVILLIFFNIIAMACIYNGISEDGRFAIETINNIFLAIFHIEAFIKISGFGTFYFKDSWNKFDFTILALTDLILIINTFNSFSEISTLPVIARALRLGRIVKYIRSSKSLRILIDTIYYLLPSLLNIAALLFLMVFIYAILGMYIFGAIKIEVPLESYPFFREQQDSHYSTFQTFWESMLIIFKCVTGQSWDFYMYQYADKKFGCHSQTYEEQQRDGIQGCGTFFSYIYFISVIIFLRLIMINLFLAMVVEGFLETLKENEAIINPNNLQILLDKWSEYDPEGTGFLSAKDVAFLLYELQPPMGLKDDYIHQQKIDENSQKQRGIFINAKRKIFFQKSQIFDALGKFNVKLYENQKCHFKDLCIQISYKAVLHKFNKERKERQFLNQNPDKEEVQKLEMIELNVEQIKILNRGWYNQYPDIKKYKRKFENKNKELIDQNVYARDVLAMQSILEIFREKQELKELRKKLMDNKAIAKKSQFETYKISQNQMQSPSKNFKKNKNNQIQIQQMHQDQNLKELQRYDRRKAIKQTKFMERLVIKSGTFVYDPSQQLGSQSSINSMQKVIPLVDKKLLNHHNFFITDQELNFGDSGINVTYDNNALIVKNPEKNKQSDIQQNDNIIEDKPHKFSILTPSNKAQESSQQPNSVSIDIDDEESDKYSNNIDQHDNAPKIYLRRKSKISSNTKQGSIINKLSTQSKHRITSSIIQPLNQNNSFLGIQQRGRSQLERPRSSVQSKKSFLTEGSVFSSISNKKPITLLKHMWDQNDAENREELQELQRIKEKKEQIQLKPKFQGISSNYKQQKKIEQQNQNKNNNSFTQTSVQSLNQPYQKSIKQVNAYYSTNELEQSGNCEILQVRRGSEGKKQTTIIYKTKNRLGNNFQKIPMINLDNKEIKNIDKLDLIMLNRPPNYKQNSMNSLDSPVKDIRISRTPTNNVIRDSDSSLPMETPMFKKGTWKEFDQSPSKYIKQNKDIGFKDYTQRNSFNPQNGQMNLVSTTFLDVKNNISNQSSVQNINKFTQSNIQSPQQLSQKSLESNFEQQYKQQQQQNSDKKQENIPIQSQITQEQQNKFNYQNQLNQQVLIQKINQNQNEQDNLEKISSVSSLSQIDL